jgi:hypothetical protein
LSSPYEAITAVAFALFGAAIASALAIPPLAAAKDLPGWIVPLFITIASAFFISGFTIVLLGRKLIQGQRHAGSEIVQEMSDIEKHSASLPMEERSASRQSRMR